MSGGALILDADPVRLSQVIANLLNNSAKYTEEGGQIRLSAHRDGAEAVVQVRDNGVGIPRAMLPRIFDWFTQADRTYRRAQGGLGIGLTLVRSFVEIHGGTVAAQSAGAGQGSAFTIRLPLVAEGQHEGAVRPEDAMVDALSLRVLIVDDNRDAARSLCMLLEFLGAEVRTCHDGASALATFDAYKPEIALLDLDMPNMTGYELARHIRARPDGASCSSPSRAGGSRKTGSARASRASIITW